MSVYLFFLTLIVLISFAIVTSFNSNNPPSHVQTITAPAPVILEQAPLTETTQATEDPVVETVSEIPVKAENNLKKAYDEEGNDLDVPNLAFPTFEDPESELAHAFTYDNLQDSMLSTSQRESVKSRAAWSRLGARNNDLLWKTQMQALKEQIEDSGMTLEQFMETTNMPIPEQFAEFWKHSLEITGEVQTKPMKQLPKEIKSEVASLIEDATQTISLSDEKNAKTTMQQVLDARKRAKFYGVSVPDLSTEQQKAIDAWASNSNLESITNEIKKEEENK